MTNSKQAVSDLSTSLKNSNTDAELFEAFVNAVESTFTKDEIIYLISYLATAYDLKLRVD
jgi:hypothetical protein